MTITKDYFVIHRTEDDVHTGWMTKLELKASLRDKENGFGGYTILAAIPHLDEFPSRSVYIINGKQVTPRPISTVVEYEF